MTAFSSDAALEKIARVANTCSEDGVGMGQ